jgi:hypothetical protein
MIRIGSEIENVLCDKLSGKIDTTKEYDSKLLIDSFRNDPKFNFVDLVGWLFGGGDWSGKVETEKYVTEKINIFISENPSPNDENFKIMNCASENCKVKFVENYFCNVSIEDKELYKQRMLDVFYS